MNKQVKAFFDQIKAVEAVYTGGCIWVFTGELKNGTFFLHDDNFDTRILSEYPDPWEDNTDIDKWSVEWQEEHLVKDLDTETEGAAFQLAVLKFIEKYKPEIWDFDFDQIRSTATELLNKRGWR